jgi:acylphosphatase
MTTRRIRILGRVQGVGYRDALCSEAGRRDVRGWVRNRADGSVEALLQGADTAVEDLVRWARLGPPLARVVEVRDEPNDDFDAHAGFRKLPTA